VAKSQDLEGKVAIYKDLLRRSWQTGLLLGTLIAVGSGGIASYLHLPSARDIVLLGFGTAIYVPLGVRRGMVPGFVRLHSPRDELRNRGNRQDCRRCLAIALTGLG